MTLSTGSEALSHKQLRHWVADRLRTAILDGVLRPGEWLRQERLAQEYGVSQMPIREALKELASEGLVEHVPYHGVRVLEFSAEDVEDLYATRSFLEGITARSAAVNITQAELNELKSIQKQIVLNFGPENLTRYRELNRRFHLLVVTSSRRSYLIRTLTQLWDAFPTMLWSNFGLTADHSTPHRDMDDISEHEAIIAALESHDPAASEKHVRHHIAKAGDELVSVLREKR